jgi:hypothetical protein
MSHHYPGPNFAFPHDDARLNFTDLFVFPNPSDNTKTILIMNAHPSKGVNPPGPTTTVPFAPDALYEIMIDTDGDNVVNTAYSVRFTDAPGGGQVATVRRIDSTSSNRNGNDGTIIASDVPVTMGRESKIVTTGGYRVAAGWRSDPFFFDAEGAINGLKFTGKDFFADDNVASIALEVPNEKFGSSNLRLWGRTVDGKSGTWVQADRGSHASQEPFLSPPDQIAYITAEPANDAQFVPLFAHALQHTGGYTPEGATQAANGLLPDVQTFKLGKPAVYPTNGRALTDDAKAHFLSVLTNGKVTHDGTHAHTDLLADFPYVGPPHNAA